MGSWKVVVPTERINFCVNPSAETDTTSWAAYSGATVTRSNDRAWKGGWSIKVVTGGTNRGVDTPYVNIDDMGMSCSVWAPTGAVITVYTVIDSTPTLVDTITGDNEWHRVETTAHGSDVLEALRIVADISCTFYVDAVQYEIPESITLDTDLWNSTYFDGDQEGCEWYGEEHASASIRYADYRGGGLIYDLEDDLGFAVDQALGIGVGPQIMQTQSGVNDGAIYQGQKTDASVITLVGQLAGASLPGTQAKRLAVWNAIKPGLVYGQNQFWLRYTGGTYPVQILVSYQAGWEMGETDGYSEEASLQLYAANPTWYELGGGASPLTPYESITNAGALTGRALKTIGYYGLITGDWNTGGAMSSGALALIEDIRITGQFYVGGAFTTAGGITVNRIGTLVFVSGAAVWAAMGTGFNSSVTSIAQLLNEDVIAAGAFTQLGSGAAMAYISRWDGSAWNALGSGMNGQVDCLVVGPDGSLYAGGNFTTAGGTTVNYIAKWDGSAWSALGTTGTNGRVYSLAIGADGYLYAGGNFTTAGGVTVNYIAKWNGTAWSALSTGMNGIVNSITAGPDGNLYLGGAFTTAGGVTVNRVTKWNGAKFAALSSGADTGTVYGLAFDPNGRLYVCGTFNNIGSLAVGTCGIAIWTGSVFVHVDVYGPSIVMKVIATRHWLWILNNGMISTETHGMYQAVTNPGSKGSLPRASLKWLSGGTGLILRMLRNEITSQSIWLNYTMQIGEQVTIDCANNQIISSYYGDITGIALLRGSEFGNFELMPGANIITMYARPAGAVSTETFLEWTPAHALADGSMR
jgi:hypothetical protein